MTKRSLAGLDTGSRMPVAILNGGGELCAAVLHSRLARVSFHAAESEAIVA